MRSRIYKAIVGKRKKIQNGGKIEAEDLERKKVNVISKPKGMKAMIIHGDENSAYIL